MRWRILAGVCAAVAIGGVTAAGAEPATPSLVGTSDPILAEFVRARVSNKATQKQAWEIRKRLENEAPKPAWAPTLRAILKRPAPPMNLPTEAARAQRQDDDFWRTEAVLLLGRLRDRDSVEPLLEQLVHGTAQFADAALISIGPPAVERAGRLLLDPADPLRKGNDTLGQPLQEGRIIDLIAPVLGAAQASEARDLVLAYGAQTVETVAVAKALTRLPKSEASAAFVKRAYLDAIAESSYFPPDFALRWGDVALLQWMQKQNVSYRAEARQIAETALALALAGDAKATQAALPDLAKFGSATDQDFGKVCAALAQRCDSNASCYVAAAKAELQNQGPQSPRVFHKIAASIAALHDASAAEALFSDGEIAQRLASPSSVRDGLLALTSVEFGKRLAGNQIFGPLVRLRSEMAMAKDVWKAQLAPGSVFVPPDARYDVAMPSGQCDLKQADWKNGQYVYRDGKTPFRLKDGHAAEDSIQEIAYGDLDGDGHVEAVVNLHNAPPYTGGGGMYTMGSDGAMVFTLANCKPRLVRALKSSAKIHGAVVEMYGPVPFVFSMKSGALVLQEAGAQTSRPSQQCTTQCSYNASCVALSSVGVFGPCCDSVAGPQFAAECRRRSGQ